MVEAESPRKTEFRAPSRNRLGVGANLVRHLTGASEDALAADNDQANLAALTQMTGRIVGDDPVRVPCCDSSHAVRVAPCERGRVSSQKT